MNCFEGNSSGIPVQVKGSGLSRLLEAQRRVWIHQFHQEFGPVIRFGVTKRNRLWLLNAVGTTILFPITEHAVALNGNVVSHFANPRAGRGVASAAKVPSYIGLQSYPGQRAQFRSIRIS